MKLTELYLTENFKNLFIAADKKKYAQEVFDLLNTAYQKAGGMKGNGFQSPEAMVKAIPFWKLYLKDGKVLTVMMYKDRNGRKLIAMGTNGTHEAKKVLIDTLKQEFRRSYTEISGPTLLFMMKNYAELYKDFRIPNTTMLKVLGADDVKLPEKDDDGYKYLRKLEGGWVEKVAVGTLGNKFY